MQLSMIPRSEHPTQTFEARDKAGVGNLRNITQAKEQEVQSLEGSDTADSRLERGLQSIESEQKNHIRELEQRLNDTNIKNSNLQAELSKLKREKTAIYNEHQEALDQLTEVQAAKRYYFAKCEGVIERYNHLRAKHKDLDIRCRELTTENRNQAREISEIGAQLESRVAQLNKFTGDIARQNQRVNTSAIRDDEYFAREFADLAKDIRNWSFTHFFPHKEISVPQRVTRDLQDDIRKISSGTNLPSIFKNRPTSRRVVAGLLANKLKIELFNPLLLGFLPQRFLELEKMIEKTGIQKTTWLSQTISLSVREEHFERRLGRKIDKMSKDLSEKLKGLVAQEPDESKASKRSQKLQTIVQRAANLAVEVSQQPSWFRVAAIAPGRRFEPCWMEDVEREASLEKVNPGSREDDCGVSLSVFPCVWRYQLAESGRKCEPVVISKAWVTVETGDSHTAIEQMGDNTTGKEAGGGAKSRVERPGGCSEYGRKPGAQGGEGSENSAHSNVPATKKGVSLRSTPPELQVKDGVNQEVGLAADTELARERGKAFL